MDTVAVAVAMICCCLGVVSAGKFFLLFYFD